MDLLVDFPTRRSKCESHVFLANKVSQERNETQRQKHRRALSVNAVTKVIKQNSGRINRGKDRKKIPNDIKPEKWSTAEYQNFSNQLFVLRASYMVSVDHQITIASHQ